MAVECAAGPTTDPVRELRGAGRAVIHNQTADYALSRACAAASKGKRGRVRGTLPYRPRYAGSRRVIPISVEDEGDAGGSVS